MSTRSSVAPQHRAEGQRDSPRSSSTHAIDHVARSRQRTSRLPLWYRTRVLTLTTRPLTAAEQDQLEARRAELVAKCHDDHAALDRARNQAVPSIVVIFTLFGLLAVWNVHAGHLETALVGFAAVVIGLVVLRRLDTPLLIVHDHPPIRRIDQVLDANQIRVLDIEADAAVVLRSVADDDGPTIAGHLLRTGADQIVYVSRELCADLDPELLPNTKLRITCSENLQLMRVEALGERCEPLAFVEDDSVAADSQWHSDYELLVWTPSEDRFAFLQLGDGEMPSYSVELALDFRRLTAALVRRIYR